MKRREITIKVSQEFEPSESDFSPEESAKYIINMVFGDLQKKLNIDIIETKDVDV